MSLRGAVRRRSRRCFRGAVRAMIAKPANDLRTPRKSTTTTHRAWSCAANTERTLKERAVVNSHWLLFAAVAPRPSPSLPKLALGGNYYCLDSASKFDVCGTHPTNATRLASPSNLNRQLPTTQKRTTPNPPLSRPRPQRTSRALTLLPGFLPAPGARAAPERRCPTRRR
ncbi:hypothetical protein VUR80DRAFT_9820 [Thermomyces stellatus]